MTDLVPWLTVLVLGGLVAWTLAETRRAARWMRRALAEDAPGPRPSGWILGLMGMEGALARAEARMAELATLRETEERRLGELLGQLTQAVLVVDGKDRLRLANPAALGLFRMDAGCAGKPFVPLARSAELVDFLHRVRAEGGRVAEVQLNRAPSADLWVRVGGAPTGAATYGPGAVILVAEDVTQLRRLQASEREFIANASHDLRTPVTILRGYAETLRDDHATMDAADRERFLGKVVDATHRLGGLLESLLALASLESGIRLERRAGALAEAAEESAEVFAERFRSAGATLGVTVGDRSGAADPVQARRLVGNLLENALAHAKGMRRVAIRVEGARIEVEDDGVGVSESDLGRVFDRFYRTDRSRRQGGSGLGLSIVRQVAELHGGRAWAEAARPRGLRVVAELGPTQTATPTSGMGVG